MKKPQRKRIDWHNAVYQTCGCGKHAAVMEGMCPECHDDAYNHEVESAYSDRIKVLREALEIAKGESLWCLGIQGGSIETSNCRSGYAKIAKVSNQALKDTE